MVSKQWEVERQPEDASASPLGVSREDASQRELQAGSAEASRLVESPAGDSAESIVSSESAEPIEALVERVRAARAPEFPALELVLAAQRREEITPHLLRILEECLDAPREYGDDAKFMAHFYAIYLLAQFREPRALPLALRFASLDDNDRDALFGDFETYDYCRVLGAVANGDPAPLVALANDETMSQCCRHAAAGGLVTMHLLGELTREELDRLHREMLRRAIERARSREDTDFEYVSMLASSFARKELEEEIREAFELDLVDDLMLPIEEFEERLAAGPDAAQQRFEANHAPIRDTVAELCSWDLFERDTGLDADRADAPVFDGRGLGTYSLRDGDSTRHGSRRTLDAREIPKPVVSRQKVGRNEPCPCGSGKKHKRCCLGR